MSKADLRNIGAKLREARQQKGLSLRDLSSLADTSPSLLSQIENGKTNPSVVTLYDIARALELPVAYFFPQTAQDDPEPPSGNGVQKLFAAQMTASEARAGSENVMPTNSVPQNSILAPAFSPVVFADERVAIELMGGVIWERLTAAASKEIEFLEIRYQPQGTSGAVMSRHGGREFGMVLEGELFLELGFEQYTLQAGDSVIFDSMTPHRLTNKQDRLMRAIWVIFVPAQM